MIKHLLILFMLTAVKGLYAQCTTCNSFSEALKNPEMVTAIKINSMQHDVMLTEVPDDILKFTNLKILWLSSHHIKTINKNICKLEKLQSLSFAENRLTQLPDCIYEMKNLKELILLFNEFNEDAKTKIKTRFAQTNPELKIIFDM